MITISTVCDIAKDYAMQLVDFYKTNGDENSAKYWEGVYRDIDELKFKVETI